MGGMSRGRDDIWGLILLSEAWWTAPCGGGEPPTKVGGLRPRRGGWPTGQGCRGSPGLGRMASGGLILLSEAWWTAPCGGGEPPTKVGGLREDILFKSKEYPLALPKKDSRGDFEFPPGTPLKRPKEGLRPFLWKPSRGWTGSGGYGGRESKAECLRSFRGFRLVGDEGGEGLVVLAPGLGGYCPARGRGSPPEPLGGQADGGGHR